MATDLSFTQASEAELNDLFAGLVAGDRMPWPNKNASIRTKLGTFGVISQDPRYESDPVRPIALFCDPKDFRRLFGRVAQLRGDFSPISSWCHVMPPDRLQTLDSTDRDAELWGYEAAWAGLIVAEAILLSQRSVPALRIAACLATQSFGFARATALWGNVSVEEFEDRYDAAQKILKATESRPTSLRPMLEPIWVCLSEAASRNSTSLRHRYTPLIQSLQALSSARAERDDNEALRFADPLRSVAPEAELFSDFSKRSAEHRLQAFDMLMSNLNRADREDHSLYRSALALMAGYIATVAAGGTPTLSLTESSSRSYPEVTAWAYVVGGIGERVVWTSSFDGLGRLVARELMRPLRLDEPPNCDFSLDEAVALYDPQLSDPLVHLKIKQARIVTVSLYPGVNLQVPIGDYVPFEKRKQDTGTDRRPTSSGRIVGSDDEVFAVLADRLWPHLRGRLGLDIGSSEIGQNSTSTTKKKNTSKKGRASQDDLPLVGSDSRKR